jgi:hypothetical protein
MRREKDNSLPQKSQNAQTKKSIIKLFLALFAFFAAIDVINMFSTSPRLR